MHMLLGTSTLSSLCELFAPVFVVMCLYSSSSFIRLLLHRALVLLPVSLSVRFTLNTFAYHIIDPFLYLCFLANSVIITSDFVVDVGCFARSKKCYVSGVVSHRFLLHEIMPLQLSNQCFLLQETDIVSHTSVPPVVGHMTLLHHNSVLRAHIALQTYSVFLLHEVTLSCFCILVRNNFCRANEVMFLLCSEAYSGTTQLCFSCVVNLLL